MLRDAKRNRCGFFALMYFHEGGYRVFSALGADFQVIAVVGERFVAPFTSSDSRGLHLGDFFEQ